MGWYHEADHLVGQFSQFSKRVGRTNRTASTMERDPMRIPLKPLEREVCHGVTLDHIG